MFRLWCGEFLAGALPFFQNSGSGAEAFLACSSWSKNRLTMGPTTIHDHDGHAAKGPPRSAMQKVIVTIHDHDRLESLTVPGSTVRLSNSSEKAL